MRKTKIICTIGPASEKPEILSQIIEAGMNVSRHNFSHGDHEEHAARINLVKELAKKHNKEIAVMLDTKGPEIRTGKFDPKKVELQAGAKFTVHAGGDVIGNTEECSVTYAGLANDVKPGDTILIDDGLVGLTVESIDGNKIHCTVQNTGFVATHKGVNVPGVSIKLPALTEKDIADLKFGCEIGVNAVAASFIRKASDVETIRQILNENGGEHIQIISKIENQEGVDNIDSILAVSDGLMVARGDLGVEIPFEKLPAVQKMMIEKCNAAGKPVVTATQMLESMQHNPRPTRAEVSDVANAIYDGTSAIMLSGESAQGDYPLNCVETMTRIANATEKEINYWKRFRKSNLLKACECDCENKDAKKQANFSVCCSALFSNADAVVAVSEDGNTASILSSFRIGAPIYVITPSVKAYRHMAIEQNVTPVLVEGEKDFNTLLNKGLEMLKEKEYLKANDTVVLSGGFLNGTSLEDQITGKIVRV